MSSNIRGLIFRFLILTCLLGLIASFFYQHTGLISSVITSPNPGSESPNTTIPGDTTVPITTPPIPENPNTTIPNDTTIPVTTGPGPWTEPETTQPSTTSDYYYPTTSWGETTSETPTTDSTQDTSGRRVYNWRKYTPLEYHCSGPSLGEIERVILQEPSVTYGCFAKVGMLSGYRVTELRRPILIDGKRTNNFATVGIERVYYYPSTIMCNLACLRTEFPTQYQAGLDSIPVGVLYSFPPVFSATSGSLIMDSSERISQLFAPYSFALSDSGLYEATRGSMLITIQKVNQTPSAISTSISTISPRRRIILDPKTQGTGYYYRVNTLLPRNQNISVQTTRFDVTFSCGLGGETIVNYTTGGTDTIHNVVPVLLSRELTCTNILDRKTGTYRPPWITFPAITPPRNFTIPPRVETS